jgi:hypothetical protein
MIFLSFIRLIFLNRKYGYHPKFLLCTLRFKGTLLPLVTGIIEGFGYIEGNPLFSGRSIGEMVLYVKAKLSTPYVERVRVWRDGMQTNRLISREKKPTGCA